MVFIILRFICLWVSKDEVFWSFTYRHFLMRNFEVHVVWNFVKIDDLLRDSSLFIGMTGSEKKAFLYFSKARPKSTIFFRSLFSIFLSNFLKPVQFEVNKWKSWNVYLQLELHCSSVNTTVLLKRESHFELFRSVHNCHSRSSQQTAINGPHRQLSCFINGQILYHSLSQSYIQIKNCFCSHFNKTLFLR